jgi:hypothetical protein
VGNRTGTSQTTPPKLSTASSAALAAASGNTDSSVSRSRSSGTTRAASSAIAHAAASSFTPPHIAYANSSADWLATTAASAAHVRDLVARSASTYNASAM